MFNLLHNARYIGDGAYANHDGYQFWIFTHDGISITNQIALEPYVISQFQRYVRDISGKPPSEDG